MGAEDHLVRRGTAQYRRALAALFAIGVSAYSLVYAPQPLLRVIGNEYAVSATETAFLMSATTFSLAFFVLVWGTLTSRIPERVVIIGGLAAAIVISILIPLAPTWILLVILRAAQGVALAGPLTATLAWVGRHVEAPSIARVSGLYIAGSTVGGMTGRLLSGFVNDAAGHWRLAVAAVSVTAVVLGGIAHVLLPRPAGRPRPPRGQPDIDVEHAPTTSQSRRTTHKADSTWHRHQRFISYGFALVGMGMFVGIYNVLVYRVAEPPWHLGTSVTSMLFLSYLAGTASSARAGTLVARLGQRAVMYLGTATMAVGIALTIPTSHITLWLGLFVLCAGFFGMHALSSGRAAFLHPQPGTGSGLYLMFYYLGSSVGSIVFGFGWDTGAWPLVVVMSVGCLIVIGVLSTFVSDAKPADPDATLK